MIKSNNHGRLTQVILDMPKVKPVTLFLPASLFVPFVSQVAPLVVVKHY